jgi:hypothetical protein
MASELRASMIVPNVVTPTDFPPYYVLFFLLTSLLSLHKHGRLHIYVVILGSYKQLEGENACMVFMQFYCWNLGIQVITYFPTPNEYIVVICQVSIRFCHCYCT